MFEHTMFRSKLAVKRCQGAIILMENAEKLIAETSITRRGEIKTPAKAFSKLPHPAHAG
jgi:hypothetical protein